MKTFSIDGELEKTLEDLQEKLGYDNLHDTLNRGFGFLQLMKVMKDDGGSFVYLAPNGENIVLDMFKTEEKKKKSKPNKKKKAGKVIR